MNIFYLIIYNKSRTTTTITIISGGVYIDRELLSSLFLFKKTKCYNHLAHIFLPRYQRIDEF